MSVESALARGRVAAERLMLDTCVIRRVVDKVEDDVTGKITPVYANPAVYTGKCRVQQEGRAQGQIQDAGQASVLVLRLEVQLPMSVVGLAVADEITITASLDPDLVGRTFRIRDLAHKTHATARRVQVQEVTG